VTAAAAPAATPEKASLLEDFIDILFSPAKVFARRAMSSPFLPLVVVAVICGVLGFVNAGTMQGVMDAEYNRAVAQALENNPSMDPAAMEGMRGIMEATAKYGIVIIIPIMILLLGTITWLVGKILGSEMNWGTGLTIATFAFVPRIIEQMVVAIQGLLLDGAAFTSRFSFSLGVGRFMDPNGPQGILNVLGRVDVFTIWVTALIVVGLIHAGKVEKNKAIIGGVIIWVIGALPALPTLLAGK
jgi:hypothetical protein